MIDNFGTIHPLVNLMRRFCVGWLDDADAEVCDQIMDPNYTVRIGGTSISGRDAEYKPATLGQLKKFPGLLISVHDLFLSELEVALHFTEHGPSVSNGKWAAWSGIGIFRWNGERLLSNITEEDYFSRRRQLITGIPDPVGRVAIAPWSATPGQPDHEAEATVRSWLEAGGLVGRDQIKVDDAWTGRFTPPLIDQHGLEIDALFSSGRRVAFHAVQQGTYLGGLEVDHEPVGMEVSMAVAGIVRVDEQGSISGNVVRDRMGLRGDLGKLFESTH